MSDPTRNRINAAFEEELAAAPTPPGLRAISVRAAVTAPRRRSTEPRLLALVAAILAVAIVATLVIGSHALRNTAPAKPIGSTTPPPGRTGAVVAFDQAHGQMVVFGGQNPPLNDTWTFDGKYWTHQRPPMSPTPRFGGAMTYDTAHHDVVLFGGLQQVSGKGGAGPVDDTWIWNGSTWREMHPEHEPAFAFDARPGMAFDPQSREVVLYGLTRSTSEASTGQAQTWSWDGSDWTQLLSAGGPTGFATMASDNHQLLLLAGSPALVAGRFLTQTWAWNGSNWTLLHPKVDLPSMAFPSTAYDSAHGQLLILSTDTWTWDGSAWSRLHPSVQPPIGYVVYMPPLHEVISWGDIYGSPDSDLWAWNGTNWTLIIPTGATVVPHVASPGNGKGGFVIHTTPDQVAAAVRANVTNTQPLLLPATPPAWAYDAVVTADGDSFNVRYQSDLRDKTIDFGIVVANPPPGSKASSGGVWVRFRNSIALKGGTSGYAEYFVYDTSSPLSARWLMWIEPGTMANSQIAGTGVPYFLSASGLTDAEFWQFANSLP